MVAKKEVESFTAEDTMPAIPEGAEATERLMALSWSELEAQSQLHIQDVEELTAADKELLVGKPFFICGWKFAESDFGTRSDYAIVYIVSENGPQWFTDGGTGIPGQLLKYEAKMRKEDMLDAFESGELGAIRVPRGLKKSQYTWTDEEGNENPGTTYYLDNRDR